MEGRMWKLIKTILVTSLVILTIGIIVVQGVYQLKEFDWCPIDNVVKLKTTNIHGKSWEGTAFFVADNLLMTTGHCIKDVNNIEFTTVDGKKFKADSWYQESEVDLGIVVVNTPKKEPVATFCDTKVGETVRVVGNPFLYFPVSTKGIISAVDINDSYFGKKKLLLTDCPINPGNSGSPLLNKRNQIVGMVVGGIFPSDGMGFCMPAKICQLVLNKYRAIEALKEIR